MSILIKNGALADGTATVPDFAGPEREASPAAALNTWPGRGRYVRRGPSRFWR